jgi:hypothetical protein
MIIVKVQDLMTMESQGYRTLLFGVLAQPQVQQHPKMKWMGLSILCLYYDNQGLVNCISASQDRFWKNPNHCLASEADLESGMVDIIERLPFAFAFHHVKGHQDADTPLIVLPWEA